VWRFVRNARVEVVEGARVLLVLAAKAARLATASFQHGASSTRGRLFVAVDWVDIRQYVVGSMSCG